MGKISSLSWLTASGSTVAAEGASLGARCCCCLLLLLRVTMPLGVAAAACCRWRRRPGPPVVAMIVVFEDGGRHEDAPLEKQVAFRHLTVPVKGEQGFHDVEAESSPALLFSDRGGESSPRRSHGRGGRHRTCCWRHVLGFSIRCWYSGSRGRKRRCRRSRLSFVAGAVPPPHRRCCQRSVHIRGWRGGRGATGCW